MVDPQQLITLLHGEFTCIHIGFNDEHSTNYANAQKFHDEWGAYQGGDEDRIEWISDEERLKAIKENSVWTIQWYPQTPNGFNCVGASTFQAAAEYALQKYGA